MACGQWIQQTSGKGHEGASPLERKSEMEPGETPQLLTPRSQLRMRFESRALPSHPPPCSCCVDHQPLISGPQCSHEDPLRRGMRHWAEGRTDAYRGTGLETADGFVEVKLE